MFIGEIGGGQGRLSKGYSKTRIKRGVPNDPWEGGLNVPWDPLGSNWGGPNVPWDLNRISKKRHFSTFRPPGRPIFGNLRK